MYVVQSTLLDPSMYLSTSRRRTGTPFDQAPEFVEQHMPFCVVHLHGSGSDDYGYCASCYFLSSSTSTDTCALYNAKLLGPHVAGGHEYFARPAQQRKVSKVGREGASGFGFCFVFLLLLCICFSAALTLTPSTASFPQLSVSRLPSFLCRVSIYLER